MPESSTIAPWQRLFVRRLFPCSASRLDIEGGIAAKNMHIPVRLYKYRDFANAYHLDTLKSDCQWFSSPEHFNDPFDSCAGFDIEGYWERAPRADQEETDFGRQFDTLRKNWATDFRAELVDRFSAVLRGGFSVLSLSATPYSTLMWAHYAASHSGFCVEYDLVSLPDADPRKRLCFPVFYRARRPNISRYIFGERSRFNNLVGQYLCLQKSVAWRYEQEWRIAFPVGPHDANGLRDMPPPTAVIVGAAASADDIALARNFCDQRAIPLRRMKMNSFNLELTLHDEMSGA